MGRFRAATLYPIFLVVLLAMLMLAVSPGVVADEGVLIEELPAHVDKASTPAVVRNVPNYRTWRSIRPMRIR